MKIIFLDIDGVLNSDMYEANRTDKLDDNRIDHSRVKLLADLVKATDAKIVLTSTWRMDWNRISALCGDYGKYLNECFATHGISILDKTPFISYFSERSKEILIWLAHHRESVESFVILDDMNYGWDKLNSRVVITNPQGYGLEEEHVQKALELLNKRIVFK